MYITPIGVNANYKRPTFGVLFNKSEIQHLASNSIEQVNKAGIPQLYTLLEYMEELSGKLASIIEKKGDKPNSVAERVLTIDGKPVSSSKDPKTTNFNLLKEYLVGDNEKSDHLRMPPNVFNIKWWENRHVKEEMLGKFEYDSAIESMMADALNTKVISYETKDGKGSVKLSNIDFIGLEKTEAGRDILDEMQSKLTDEAASLFSLKRKVARKRFNH
jgi:hypothetical protein